MKTVHAPDTFAALSARVHDAATGSPVLAFVVLVLACAAFAAWAVRSF